MGNAIPSQNPAVVLRSHFNQLRALLVVALMAVIGLTVTVVIQADDEQTGGVGTAQPIGHINYGGFSPATGRPLAAPVPQPEPHAPIVSRYEGGAGESTRGAVKDYSMNSATGDISKPSAQAPNTRYDGGPDEGTRGPGFSTD